jgi:hypothetical protein
MILFILSKNTYFLEVSLFISNHQIIINKAHQIIFIVRGSVLLYIMYSVIIVVIHKIFVAIAKNIAEKYLAIKNHNK